MDQNKERFQLTEKRYKWFWPRTFKRAGLSPTTWTLQFTSCLCLSTFFLIYRQHATIF